MYDGNKSDLIDSIMGKEAEYLSFPSHFDVAIRIKQAVSDYTRSIEYVAEIIKCDPLISMKVLQEASRRNRTGIKMTNLAKAVNVLGFEHIKRIALVMSVKQIDKSRGMIKFVALSRLIWLNSLYTASAAHVTANKLTSFDPEEAFMCGLMLNVGAFYLLHQACLSPQLKNDYTAVVDGIDHYYLSRTKDVLTIFEMSPVCLSAVAIEKTFDRHWPEDFIKLRDVIHAANTLAAVKFPWVTADVSDIDISDYSGIIPEIDEMFLILKNNDF